MARPTLLHLGQPLFNPPLDAVFQQLEIDYTSAPSNRRFYGEQLKEAPILRMFGVTEHGNAWWAPSCLILLLLGGASVEAVGSGRLHHRAGPCMPRFLAGNSVCTFVHGFEPYFYVECPRSTFSPDDCRSLKELFDVRGGAWCLCVCACLYVCVVGVGWGGGEEREIGVSGQGDAMQCRDAMRHRAGSSLPTHPPRARDPTAHAPAWRARVARRPPHVQTPHAGTGRPRPSLPQNLLSSRDRSGNGRCCLRVEVVQAQTMMHYQAAAARPFLKVTLTLPGLVAPARSLVEGGLWMEWLACRLPPTTYESNVLYVLRFMVDRGVVGGSWVELPPGKYSLVPAQVRLPGEVVVSGWKKRGPATARQPRLAAIGELGTGTLRRQGASWSPVFRLLCKRGKLWVTELWMLQGSAGAGLPAESHRLPFRRRTQAQTSHCQLEAQISAQDLLSHVPEGEWAKLAPFRILSVDIECQGRKVGSGPAILGRGGGGEGTGGGDLRACMGRGARACMGRGAHTCFLEGEEAPCFPCTGPQTCKGFARQRPIKVPLPANLCSESAEA